ncbi:MAG: HAMP domain-containing histidine kinase [Clostridia bacterium]|nr:HAMP domain-containing histidine kinase [Clostridia bacterium]
MATKWKNYKGIARALAILMAILSAFSAMYCGFFACRDELLYDFDKSQNYYNTMFFESAVQKRMAEIRTYAQQSNKNALTMTEEEKDAVCAELRDALLGVSRDLYARYAVYGFTEDIFEGCTDADDYFRAFHERRPELRDKPDEGLFYEFAYNAADEISTESQRRAYELIDSGAYEFTAEIGGDRFALPAVHMRHYYSTRGGEDVVSTSVPVTEPADGAEEPTAAETTAVALSDVTQPEAVPSTRPPAETTAAYTTPTYDFYKEYDEYTGQNQWDPAEVYSGSREIARWLADCYALRTFLIGAVKTVDPEKLAAAQFTAEPGPFTYQPYRTEDLFDDSFAQYLYYYPETGEYITNIAEYKQKGETPMFSSADAEKISAAVAGPAEKAEWRVIVTPDRAEHNIGNGADADDTLRKEALGYTRMSYCLEEMQASGGEFYMFASDKARESDVFSYIERDFEKAKLRQPFLIGGAAIGAFVFLISAVYILTFGTKVPVGIDKLYNDWHFLLSGGLAAAAFYCGAGLLVQVIEAYGLLGSRYHTGFMREHTWDLTAMELLTPPLFAVGALILLEYLASVIRSGRNGRLIRHSFWFALPCWAIGKARTRSRRIPKYYKKQFFAVLIVGVVLIFSLCIVEIALSDRFESGPYAFGCLLALGIAIAVLVIVLRHIRGIDEIAVAAERIRNGDLTAEIDLAKLPKHLRSMADSVLRNRDGIKAAVEKSVRDERMKTALITNVSHDLKTPLTSIITYSDLLSKRELSDEEAEKYVGVINEKAITLKRLIEDLVEASKASTGNIKIEKVNLNMYEIALQTVGEYADELEKRGLEVVVNEPPQAVIVSADSRQTWRIIENLLSNVKKYAMKGTRVYIDLRRQGAFGVFEIKNVSETPLNIPPEELTQRFVRGDASRTTEGSGLGLSIARSLCELQGGRFEIAIDGDLFKVDVALPVV